MKRVKQSILKPDLPGLVNPIDDESLAQDIKPLNAQVSAPPQGCGPLSIVWVKVAGYKPSWSPGIVSHILPSSTDVEKRYFVFFIDNLAFEAAQETENTSPSNGKTSDRYSNPEWYIQSQSLAAEGEHNYSNIPRGVQYAWVAEADVNAWHSGNRDKYIKTICGLDARKRVQYQNAIAYGDRMHADPSSIPLFVLRDSNYRESVQKHTDSVQIDLTRVRPALKLEHLKVFLEANMIELHWRTIAYARQFVKAVKDEVFGGFHLIAAQDWPRDADVDRGVPDVFLIYPGTILTEDEANKMDSDETCRKGIHEDRNRYVAEIPNTAEILDKSGTYNINYTRKNLFVDGFKYSDPESPLWAPGPTVNHERVKYCKLAPHHVSGNDSIRGFWLQRKRGEVIVKGEPLFWSYDCGAGKFDSDFRLDQPNVPPPVGWRSSKSILAAETNRK